MSIASCGAKTRRPSGAGATDCARTNSMIEELATSGYGTSVWTGRALQVGYDGLEIVGLAHLYSAL